MVSHRLPTGSGLPRLQERWPSAQWFVVVGFIGIVAGGLVAAATGPLQWTLGSWAAAYLVLVAGVAQLGLGAGQTWLADVAPSPRIVLIELLSWNIGNALVISGTLVGRLLVVGSFVVDLGGVLLVVGLVLFIRTAWKHRSDTDRGSRWVRRCYLLLALIVLVSIPVGLVLAALRNH